MEYTGTRHTTMSKSSSPRSGPPPAPPALSVHIRFRAPQPLLARLLAAAAAEQRTLSDYLRLKLDRTVPMEIHPPSAATRT